MTSASAGLTVDEVCRCAGVDPCTYWKMQDMGLVPRSRKRAVIQLRTVVEAIPEYKWRCKYSGDYDPLKKKCSQCGSEKPISDFRRAKSKAAKYGYVFLKKCRGCEYQARKSNMEEYKREWWSRPDVRARRANREVERRNTDPRYALDRRISKAVRKCLNEGSVGWRDALPFSVGELVNHIERQFLPGMTWHNMDEWHIDHIIPKSSFEYETPEDPEFVTCWGLPNLRPLWAKDNVSKGAKILTLL